MGKLQNVRKKNSEMGLEPPSVRPYLIWPNLQREPAKVRPTYIFDGNIWMHR